MQRFSICRVTQLSRNDPESAFHQIKPLQTPNFPIYTRPPKGSPTPDQVRGDDGWGWGHRGGEFAPRTSPSSKFAWAAEPQGFASFPIFDFDQDGHQGGWMWLRLPLREWGQGCAGWIPAFAGMTKGAGTTKGAGMTKGRE